MKRLRKGMTPGKGVRRLGLKKGDGAEAILSHMSNCNTKVRLNRSGFTCGSALACVDLGR